MAMYSNYLVEEFGQTHTPELRVRARNAIDKLIPKPLSRKQKDLGYYRYVYGYSIQFETVVEFCDGCNIIHYLGVQSGNELIKKILEEAVQESHLTFTDIPVSLAETILYEVFQIGSGQHSRDDKVIEYLIAQHKNYHVKTPKKNKKNSELEDMKSMADLNSRSADQFLSGLKNHINNIHDYEYQKTKVFIPMLDTKNSIAISQKHMNKKSQERAGLFRAILTFILKKIWISCLKFIAVNLRWYGIKRKKV